MQRQHMRTDIHCVSTQSVMRSSVSQDAQATAAHHCRQTSANARQTAASVAQHDHKAAVFLSAAQRASYHQHDTGGSAHPSRSAFDKCTSSGSLHTSLTSTQKRIQSSGCSCTMVFELQAQSEPAHLLLVDSMPGSPEKNGDSGQSLGVVGQAMIVTSRIEGYCRAVWGLLLRCADENDEGTCLEQQESPGSSPASSTTAQACTAPLLKFLAAVRLLVQHLILLRLQALHISAAANESDARSLLQHVLLWQHLRQNSVMELITLAMQQGAGSPPATGRGCNAAHGSFLMSTGVPLVQQAITQVPFLSFISRFLQF